MIERHMVSFILYTADDRVLLQQRDDKPDLAYGGYWTIFGGAVEAGESPEAAVRRELEEELALALPLHHVETYTCPIRSIPDQVAVRVHVYAGELTQSVESLTLHEGQAMALFDAESAARLDLAFGKSPVLTRWFATRAQTLG